jgi:hypothetical protein
VPGVCIFGTRIAQPGHQIEVLPHHLY